MKITTKLTAEQRQDIEKRIAEMEGITVRHQQALEALHDLSEKLCETLRSLVETDKKSKALDVQASMQLPGLREHKARLEEAVEKLKAEIDEEISAAMNSASGGALGDIKRLCAPLVAKHHAELEKLLAPYFYSQPRLLGVVGECDSLNDLLVFLQRQEIRRWEDVKNAGVDFAQFRARLAAILETGVVWEFEGCAAA